MKSFETGFHVANLYRDVWTNGGVFCLFFYEDYDSEKMNELWKQFLSNLLYSSNEILP